jgi:hypothetical protein
VLGALSAFLGWQRPIRVYLFSKRFRNASRAAVVPPGNGQRDYFAWLLSLLRHTLCFLICVRGR